MIPIVWDERFKTGVPAIDRVHRRLVDLINEAGTPGSQQPDEVISCLFSTALRHFELEDALLSKSGIDRSRLCRHRLDHASFLAGLAPGTEPGCNAAESALSESAVHALGVWLGQHLLVHEPMGSQPDTPIVSIPLPSEPADDSEASLDPDQPVVAAESPPSVLRLLAEQQRRLDDLTLRLTEFEARDAVSTEGRVESNAKRNDTGEEAVAAALEESEQQLNLVLERTGTGIWDWDFESGRVRLNRSWYTMLGYEPEEFPSALETWERLVHPDDIGAAWAAVTRMQESRFQHEPFDTVFRMRTKEGGWRSINSRAVVVRRDSDGRPARVVGTHIDLTERLRVEAVLHEQQEKLAALFRAAPIGIAMVVDRVLREVNETFCRLTGYGHDELIGQSTQILYRDFGEYERVGEIKARSVAENSLREINSQWLRKDGTLIDVVLNVTALDRSEPSKGVTLTVMDVTARKRVEAALTESEARYALAMKATRDGLWDWNVATGDVQYSPSWLRIIGETDFAPKYDSWAERVHPDDLPAVMRSLSEHYAGVGDSWEQEHRLRTASGEWRWVLGRGRVVERDPSGNPLRMVGTMTDISERKRSEMQLRELSARLELAITIGDLGFFELDLATGQASVNPEYLAHLGFRPGDVTVNPKFFERQVHPDDFPPMLLRFRGHLDGDSGHFEGEYRMRHRDGSWVWILERSRVSSRDADGRPLKVMGVHLDITARKAAERERALLTDTIGASLNEIYLFDAETLKFRYANQGALANLGYSLEEIRRLTPLDLKPKLTPEAFDRVVTPLRVGDQTVQVFEAEHRRADGSLYPVEVHLQLFDHAGERVYLAVIQDVTERKRAEAAQREVEERFGLWLEATDSVFWTAALDGKLTGGSPSLERLTGLAPAECLGQGFGEAIHPDDREARELALGFAASNRMPYEIELRYWHAAAGEYRWYLERGVPYRPDGAAPGWLGAGVNIESQKRAEGALHELLRQKDEFIAMLGHELRNPLAPLRNANNVLANLAGQESELLWVQRIFDRHVGHLVRIVDDLLDVSRLQRGKISLRVEPVSVAALMDQIAESAAPLMATRNQHLTVTVPADPLMIRGDAVRLTQVFDNLLGNAIRYTPDGGAISFSVARDGDRAVFRVKDTGAGMSADLLSRVFEPFAQGPRSLDRSEGGLGIGLTLARELVSLHGGEIAAHSDGRGLGSEFQVWLPLLLGSSDSFDEPGVEEDDPSPPDASGSLRILVVDDNFDAARSLSLLLEFYGHEVKTTLDGFHALELAREFKPEIVLLDIGLPGMDGFSVAQTLKQMPEASRTRIVAVTGYAQSEYRERAKRSGFDEYLVKPVRLVDIQRLLESIDFVSPSTGKRGPDSDQAALDPE